MQMVVLTALGVGGATVLGALLGFLFRDLPHKWNDGVLSFAAGVMLAAAVLGLIVPSVEAVGTEGMWITALGILCGALFLNGADRLTPHLHHLTGVDEEQHRGNSSLNKVMLFVMAIAIHNLPEGIAAGVSAGTENLGNAFSVAAGICLQNIPEGMVIIAPMLAAGVTRGRTFCIAIFTGLVEVIGTFAGFFAANIAAVFLPFALAFAGGTMLYVIGDEMIPETHSHGYEQMATYSLLIGFILMLIMDFYMG